MHKKIVVLVLIVTAAVLMLNSTVFAEGEEPPETGVVDEITAAEAPPSEGAESQPELPDEEPPVEETPAADPLEEDPAADPPDEEPPAEETPAEEPTEKTQTEEPPAEETPEEELPAEEPAQGTDPDENPAGEQNPESEPEATEPADESEDTNEEAENPADIVLVDEEGEPLVMASEEAAESLASPDPYFVSGGVTYSFYTSAGACGGAANCFDGLSNAIQAAVDYIQANGTTPDDGSIYVEKGTYTGDVTLNGALPNLGSLTGLIGLPTNGVYPTIKGALSILNFSHGFTLSGFNVTKGVSIKNSAGSAQESFVVEDVKGSLEMDNITVYAAPRDCLHIKNHKGSITLSDISVIHSSNGGHAVWVENQTSGNLTITNSEIRFNTGVGLKLETTGKVTIDEVYIQDNFSGIEVEGFSSLLISNTHTTSNDQYGILAQSAGKAVTLENVFADSNGVLGNTDYGGIFILNASTVLIKDTRASFTKSHGIKVTATGKITLTNCSVFNNVLSGIDLYSSKSSVTLDGILANANHVTGISILSRGATLRNVIANSNGEYGIRMVLSGRNALLENVEANGNFLWGIYFDTTEIYPKVVSKVTVKNSSAGMNSQGGIFIRTLGSVTLSNCGAFDNQGNDGIYIATRSKVVINSTQAASNDCDGLHIEGIYTQEFFEGEWRNVAMTSPSSVTINIIKNSQTSNTFTQNGASNSWDRGMSGLQVISQKSVKIYNFEAHENHGYGIYVRGPELYDPDTATTTMQRAGTVTIVPSSSDITNSASNNMTGIYVYAAGTVSLSGVNTESNNVNGIHIDTLGKINVQNVRDNNSQGSNGIVLNNTSATKYIAVSIRKLEISNMQSDEGSALLVQSRGTISAKDLNLYDNRCAGAVLQNDGTGKGNITLSNFSIENSNGMGIDAQSNGSIVLTNVHANNNGQGGAFLYNQDAAKSASIKLTNSEFSQNGSFGVQVLSRGTITLKNVTANDNYDRGIDLSNAVTGSKSSISLQSVGADNNNGSGIIAQTNGKVQIKYVSTNNNAKRDGWLGNESDEGFTVQDFFNQMYGWDQWNFTADSSTAQNFLLRADAAWPLNRTDFEPMIALFDMETNEEIPVEIDCESEPGACSFNFLPEDHGFSETHDFYVLVGSNTNDGFYRLSRNDPDPDSVEEMYFVSGANITAGSSVTIKGMDSNDNSLVGLGATTTDNGSIKLSSTNVSNNGAEGIFLTCGQNPEDLGDSGWGTGSITISNSSTDFNGWEGLIMATSGSVTLKQVDAIGNGQATGSIGVLVRDDHAARSVTISGLMANDNGGGLSAHATGNITVAKADISNNGGMGGIYLDNCLENEGVCTGSGIIKLTNVIASNNQANGMELYSNRIITLRTVEGCGNGQTGIIVSNRFDGSTANLVFSKVYADYNTMTGMRATTNGSLLVSNISASDNNLNQGGMNSGETVQDYLNQRRGPDFWFFEAEAETPYTFTLLADGTDFDLNPLNQLDFDPYLALYAVDEEGNMTEITGGITITHIENESYQIEWTPGPEEGGLYNLEVSTNSNNGYYRLSINHDASEYDRFFVDGFSYEADGKVVISGKNNFSGNEQTGLVGSSQSTVTLTNIYANGNGKEGMFINNLGGEGKVTIKGINMASENGWEGLRIDSDDVVNLNELDASRNGLSGARIHSLSAKLSDLTLSNNGGDGLHLETFLDATVDNLRAWSNQDCGAYFNTNGANLTVKNSSFLANGVYGLAYMNDPEIVFTAFRNSYQINGGNYPDGRYNLVALTTP